MRCPHCNGYIDDRPKGDFPGTHLLITKDWSKEEAYALLVKELRQEWGLDEESIPKIDDMQSYDVGWGYDYDSYHYPPTGAEFQYAFRAPVSFGEEGESEGGWWICSEYNKVTKRFEAWGLET